MAEQQIIPARHGTATFVPAGQTIKIINTSGTQVVDTWAFALPQPPEPKADEKEKGAEKKDEPKKQQQKQETPQKKTPSKKGADLPSQEDAEKATQQGLQEGEQTAQNAGQQKNTWSSYVPSLGWSSGKKDEGGKAAGGETEQQKNSRTWGSYFPSGKGFSNYVPKSASDTVSSFAATHQRDPNKSYLLQLQDFSRTPVGAAGWSGLSALSGSGYTSSMYAGYQAWNAKNAANAPQMEYLSMPHSRAAMLHLRPRVNDTLVSNLREPLLTLVEDTSGGVHDTLMAACDPQRYRGLNVDNWEEHGSCAENLVLALKELNERAGLKGAKAVGADVTINSVPAPLNLFMNIPWDDSGDISFSAPKSKTGGFVSLKAERDVVIVMSACPQDVLDINDKSPQDAHFVVEDNETTKEAVRRTTGPVRKRPPPRKISSSHATSTVGSQSVAGAPPAAKKPVPQRRTVPQKKTPGATPAPASGSAPTQQSSTTANKAAPKPASAASKKKPVPKPVQPQKKAPAAASGAADEGAGSSTAAPAERKKPRKLTPRPKPAAAANGE